MRVVCITMDKDALGAMRYGSPVGRLIMTGT